MATGRGPRWPRSGSGRLKVAAILLAVVGRRPRHLAPRAVAAPDRVPGRQAVRLLDHRRHGHGHAGASPAGLRGCSIATASDTTKTVWVLTFARIHALDPTGAIPCSDPAYRDFIVDLQRQGLRDCAARRARRQQPPRPTSCRAWTISRRSSASIRAMHVNHSLNQDNLYWGQHLWSFAPFTWATPARARHEFSGHDRGRRISGATSRSSTHPATSASSPTPTSTCWR